MNIYYVYLEIGTGHYMIDYGYYTNPTCKMIGKTDSYEKAQQMITDHKEAMRKAYSK